MFSAKLKHQLRQSLHDNDRLKLGTTLRYHDRLTLTPKLRWIGGVTKGRKKAPANAKWRGICGAAARNRKR